MRDIPVMFLAGFLLLFANFSKADAPPSHPIDRVSCSFSTRYCLKTDVEQKLLIMIDNTPSASREELQTAQRAFGHLRFLSFAASTVKFPSSSKELWRITIQKKPGFYKVADDGVHYVEDCYGNMLNNNDLDLVLFQFYAKDIKLGILKLKDIIYDLSSLRPTVSHFNWKRDDIMSGVFEASGQFVIRTVENMEFKFDVTGALLDENPIPPASQNRHR
jgi:hypothetical protein